MLKDQGHGLCPLIRQLKLIARLQALHGADNYTRCTHEACSNTSPIGALLRHMLQPEQRWAALGNFVDLVLQRQAEISPDQSAWMEELLKTGDRAERAIAARCLGTLQGQTGTSVEHRYWACCGQLWYLLLHGQHGANCYTRRHAALAGAAGLGIFTSYQSTRLPPKSLP